MQFQIKSVRVLPWYQQEQNQAQFVMVISIQKQEMWAARKLCNPLWKILSCLLNVFAVVATFLHEKEKS